MTIRPCELCVTPTEHEALYEIRRCVVYRCRVCGLGSTALPPGLDPVAIYDDTYFRGGQMDGYGDYAASEAILRREFRRSVSTLVGHVPAGGRLLEVGSAYGFFLDEARRHYDCVGIEVSPGAAARARARGLDVRHGTLDRVAADERLGDFDAVVMLDVIEHLERPSQTLALVRSFVRPGGVLLITTGDWASPLARIAGRRWRLMTPPQHLFFYSKSTLGALLGRAGFEPIDWTHPWKTVPVGLAAYQVVRRLGIRLPVSESLHRIGIPVNLFDAWRVIARKSG